MAKFPSSETDRGEGRVRAASTLTVLSAVASADELAQAVGLPPDERWSRGDPRGLPGRRHPYNGVSYNSDLDERASPSDHCRSLVARLRPVASAVMRVAEASTTPTASVQLAVVEHTERDNVDVWLEPGDLAAIAAMGATLRLDVYFYEDE